MKALYFLKWLFDWNRWYGFQKRYAIYTIVGFAIGFATQIPELFLLPAGFIWIDLMYTMAKDSWDRFNKEQSDILKNIAEGDKKL